MFINWLIRLLLHTNNFKSNSERGHGVFRKFFARGVISLIYVGFASRGCVSGLISGQSEIYSVMNKNGRAEQCIFS